jgi:hypothetical protein
MGAGGGRFPDSGVWCPLPSLTSPFAVKRILATYRSWIDRAIGLWFLIALGLGPSLALARRAPDRQPWNRAGSTICGFWPFCPRLAQRFLEKNRRDGMNYGNLI